MGAKLTSDDAFLSNPAAGFIVYRLSAPHIILKRDKAKLDEFTTLEIKIKIMSILSSEPAWRHCSNLSKCMIKFRRYYTPILHHLSPQVVYYDMMTTVNFDPKSITDVL
jgi:hypothetical protein